MIEILLQILLQSSRYSNKRYTYKHLFSLTNGSFQSCHNTLFDNHFPVILIGIRQIVHGKNV